MIFCVLDDDENSRNSVHDFLLKNEPFCVSLMNRFIQKDAKIFVLKNDSEKIFGVISFSKGGQLLQFIELPKIPYELQMFRAMIGKAFEEKYFEKLFSIIGTAKESELIAKIAENHLKKNIVHEIDYDLMAFESTVVRLRSPDGSTSAERNASGSSEERNASSTAAERNVIGTSDGQSQIFCCNVNHLDEIFELQAEYEKEEVVFNQNDFNEDAAKLILKKNLEKGRIWALKNEGKFCSKLSLSAKGESCILLGGIFTAKNQRKKGFAKQLVLKIAERYESKKIETVLFVKKSNEAALKLYESTGFKKISDWKILYF